MSRPDDIPQAVWDKANEADTDCQRNSCKERACNGFLCVRALRIAIMAAVAEERARWHPAVTYFDRYCQDEADGVENCVCGVQQHEDAKAFAAIRRED